ncbi:NAD(P)H-dependent amine dehydrogenase family protein [Dactylosporangium sp. CA-052675]|uniref:NAD(P)H-dependent amine dehydrogenase family protein n=1 Tax=Dactylosporangium sp. CA-052675 TaxID=3239927 RepID=UPI003D8C3F9C
MATRVIQWATGAIGRTTLRAILDSPDLELAGLYVYGERKAGRDAGDIARRPPTGVAATRDIERILTLDADVVIHTPRLRLDYGEHDEDICRLLRSGKNVITTAGHHHPEPGRRARFERACAEGGTTLFGVGISPGVIGERLALALSGVAVRLDRIEIDEVLDASAMPDPDFVFNVMGMGGDPAAVDLTGGTLPVLFGELYAETLRFMGDAMGVRYDRIEPDHHLETAAEDLTVAAGVIRRGTVVATEWRWHGIVAGERFVTLAIIWTMDPARPRYAGRDHWTIHLHGKPEVVMTLNLIEPDEPGVRTTAAQYVTAGPVIRAIPLVLAAPPGILDFSVFGAWSR